MAFPPITVLPEAPIRGDTPAVFAQKANDFVAALPTFRTDVNLAGTYIDAAVLAAETAEANAELAETNAEAAAAAAAGDVQAELESLRTETLGYRNEAEGFTDDAELAAASAASSANFKGPWSSLTGALAIPASVYHEGQHWNLLVTLDDVTASEPAIGNSDWAMISSGVSGLTPLTASGTLAVNTIYSVDATGDFTFVVPTGVANGDVIEVKRNGFGGHNVFTGAFRNGEQSLILSDWNYDLQLSWSASRSLWIYG
jgi:hypothetical protein